MPAARGVGRPGTARPAPAAARRPPAVRRLTSSRRVSAPAPSVTSRLCPTSSATCRSATSRSAARFSIRKKLLSAASMRSGGIDLARAQPIEQLLRCEVDEHDLVGAAEHLVGDRLAHADAAQLRDLVVERFEVLHVDRREHVDSRRQHVLDVLVALLVLHAGHVGVRELVDQAQLGSAQQDPRAGPSPRGWSRGTRRGGAGGSAVPRRASRCPRGRWVSSRPITTSRPASCSAWPSSSIRNVLPTPAAIPRNTRRWPRPAFIEARSATARSPGARQSRRSFGSSHSTDRCRRKAKCSAGRCRERRSDLRSAAGRRSSAARGAPRRPARDTGRSRRRGTGYAGARACSTSRSRDRARPRRLRSPVSASARAACSGERHGAIPAASSRSREGARRRAFRRACQLRPEACRRIGG